MAGVEPSYGYAPDERMARVEVGLSNVTATVAGLAAQFSHLSGQVNGRPSWIATTLLTMSAAMNGALLSALVLVLTTR